MDAHRKTLNFWRNAIKHIIFGVGCICVILCSIAISSDSKFNGELEDAKHEALRSVDLEVLKITNKNRGKDALLDYEGSYLGHHLSLLIYQRAVGENMGLKEKKMLIRNTFDEYKRYSTLEFSTLALCVAFTLFSLFSLVTYVNDENRSFATNIFLEITYCAISLAFLIASVLELYSVYDLESLKNTRDWVPSCGSTKKLTVGEEDDDLIAQARLSSFHICQDFSLKILTGMFAFLNGILSGVLAGIYIVVKPPLPPSKKDSILNSKKYKGNSKEDYFNELTGQSSQTHPFVEINLNE